MKSISRFFLMPVAAALIGGFLWTCSEDFLELAPRGALSESVLSSEAGIEGLLLGAYSSLGGRGNYFSGASNWANGSIQGGEANKGTNDGDFTDINDLVQYQLDPASRIPRDRWNGVMDGLSRANSTLSILAISEDPQITAEDRARLEGEARFLRAHYFFQMKISFDQAPLLMPGMNLEEQQMAVSTRDLYPVIESDLQFAFDNLPETQAEDGRANKWAAGAYLGKVYLYQGKWNEAKNLLQNVVDNGQTTNGQKYALLDSYPDAFNAEFDNSSESVFAVQAAANSGSTNNANPDYVLNFIQNGPGGCCGFFQPTYDFVNSHRTENGLPLLDNSYNDEDNRLAQDLGIESFDPDKPGETSFDPDEGPLDPRLDHTVGRRGIPYLDWGIHPGKNYIRDQTYAGPWSPKKFVFYQAQQGNLSDGTSWTAGYGAMNYNIIRFADVLLMLAEAEIETGNLEAGRALINQIRERAANSILTDGNGDPVANYEISLYDGFADADQARAALRMERKLELGQEGHRFFDLRRWGVANDELNRIVDFESMFLPVAYANAQFTTPQDLFYPIPQGQIDLQGTEVLPQNPGY